MDRKRKEDKKEKSGPHLLEYIDNMDPSFIIRTLINEGRAWVSAGGPTQKYDSIGYLNLEESAIYTIDAERLTAKNTLQLL